MIAMNLNNLHRLSLRLMIGLALVFLVFGNAAGAEDFLNDESYDDKAVGVKDSDPLEPFNRAMFTFNDKVYVWVLDPVATGYSKVLPADIRQCVGNFFYNFGEPIRSVNFLLQGRLRDSGLALSRFAINSIAGVFGLADPAADEFKIPRKKATFGQTLSVWGVGDGFYLVVPLLGSSTLRDFSGKLVETLATSSYYPWNEDAGTSVAVLSGQVVNDTSLRLGVYEDIKSMSFDPYVAFRNAYFQSRDKATDNVLVPNPNYDVNH